MKRSLRIILPLLVLVLAVVLTTGIAFGASSVPTKHMATSATSKPAYSAYLTSNNDGTNWNLYAFTAPVTGRLWMDVTAPAENETSTTVAVGKKVNGVLDDSKLSVWISANDVAENEGYLDVVKGNTYYVGVKSSSYYAPTKVKVRTFVYAYSNNRKLTQSKNWLLSSGYKGSSESTVINYKVVPAKTGVMTVSLKEYGSSASGGYVTLLSKGKKARSEKLYYYSTSDYSKVQFGVKKGVTYYLKVQNCYGYTSYCQKYGIKYSIKAATDRSLSKKSRALKLGRKKAAKGALFIAKGASENDWYKFYVSKKRETKIRINTTNMSRGSDDKLTVTFYKGSKKIDSVTVSPGKTNDITLWYGTTYGKASKGTYYIKVHRNAKLSGKYTIKYVS